MEKLTTNLIALTKKEWLMDLIGGEYLTTSVRYHMETYMVETDFAYHDCSDLNLDSTLINAIQSRLKATSTNIDKELGLYIYNESLRVYGELRASEGVDYSSMMTPLDIASMWIHAIHHTNTTNTCYTLGSYIYEMGANQPNLEAYLAMWKIQKDDLNRNLLDNPESYHTFKYPEHIGETMNEKIMLS